MHPAFFPLLSNVPLFLGNRNEGKFSSKFAQLSEQQSSSISRACMFCFR
jgi:hypothetical protein